MTFEQNFIFSDNGDNLTGFHECWCKHYLTRTVGGGVGQGLVAPSLGYLRGGRLAFDIPCFWCLMVCLLKAI